MRLRVGYMIGFRTGVVIKFQTHLLPNSINYGYLIYLINEIIASLEQHYHPTVTRQESFTPQKLQIEQYTVVVLNR